MVGTPRRQERVVAEGHDAGRIGISVRRQLLHRHLCFRTLRTTAERQQHGRSADRRIEHLDQPLLREDVVVRQVHKHLFAQRTALHLAAERIAFLDRTDRGLGIVLGPCAVDELARKIDH